MNHQCDFLEARQVIHTLAKTPSSRYIKVEVSFRGPDRIVGNRDRATHLIHWYPAKMFHRIPQAILTPEVVKQGSVVLDPFCGSGTVLVEAVLAGYNAIGIDINPLACLISRVKTTPLNEQHLLHHFYHILAAAHRDISLPPADSKFEYWFKPQAKRALWNLSRSIGRIRHRECREFFLVSLSGIVRRASWADPSIAPPVKMNRQRALRANSRYLKALSAAEETNRRTTFSAFSETVKKNIERIKKFQALCPTGQAVTLGERRHAARTGLAHDSVDVILTSPPYCGAQKYVRSLNLEMKWLGLSEQQIAEIDRLTLGTERTPICQQYQSIPDPEANRLLKKISLRNPTRAAMFSSYVRYLYDFVSECKRVLKPGGQAFVTFGTSHIAGYRVEMDKYFRAAASREGFNIVATIVDNIPSRGMITKRHKSAACISDERVVWIRKSDD